MVKRKKKTQGRSQADVRPAPERLKHLIVSGEDILINALSHCFAEDDFCRPDEIERLIEESGDWIMC